MKEKIYGVFGSVFIDDKTIVMQAASVNEENMILCSSAENRSFYLFDGKFPWYRRNPFRFNSPLALSPDRQQAAYWVFYKNDLRGEDVPENYSLWLSVFDIRDNITTRLIRLSEAKWPEKAWNDSIWSRQFTKWSPSPKYPYIATTPQGKIVIVDANKKSIIKTIDMGVPKSLRWSGDGRYLGFLILDVIYIYDVEKDTMVRVSKEQGCFDFLWVP